MSTVEHRLSQKEIDTALANVPELTQRVVWSIAEVATFFGVPKKTIYRWVQEGCLDGCYRRRGKRLYFWRDRIVRQFFNGPQWPRKPVDE